MIAITCTTALRSLLPLSPSLSLLLLLLLSLSLESDPTRTRCRSTSAACMVNSEAGFQISVICMGIKWNALIWKPAPLFTKLTIHSNLYENLTDHDEASRPVASHVSPIYNTVVNSHISHHGRPRCDRTLYLSVAPPKNWKLGSTCAEFCQNEGEGSVFAFSPQSFGIPGPRQRRDQEGAPGGTLCTTVWTRRTVIKSLFFFSHSITIDVWWMTIEFPPQGSAVSF